jgi:hypothetical protein
MSMTLSGGRPRRSWAEAPIAHGFGERNFRAALERTAPLDSLREGLAASPTETWGPGTFQACLRHAVPFICLVTRQ